MSNLPFLAPRSRESRNASWGSARPWARMGPLCCDSAGSSGVWPLRLEPGPGVLP